MKVIIAGSRSLDHNEQRYMTYLRELTEKFEDDYERITLVVSGRARGPDRLGEMWAQENGIGIAAFPAQWDLHGKAAGPIRNQEMGEFADAGIILWDGQSFGAKHMAEVLRKLGKPFILDIFEPMGYNEHLPSGKIIRKLPGI